MERKLLYFLFFITIHVAFSQSPEKTKEVDPENELIVKNRPKNQIDLQMNPLAPAKAAFYSAILPGLGQAYNKKYWMIPIVYGTIGSQLYFYSRNNKKYNDFMTAYKLDLAGKPHEFDNLDRSALERGINFYKKNRDLSLFIAIGFYVLNIVEANVDAHLPNTKINTDLSYEPIFIMDPVTNKMTYGASVSFNF